MTAAENITLPQDLARTKPDPAWLDRVIDTMQLRTRLHHKPSELSGGQQQRAVSARGNQPLSPDVIAAVKAVPGIGTVTRQRYALAQYQDFEIGASGIDTATADQAVKAQYLAGDTTALVASRAGSR